MELDSLDHRILRMLAQNGRLSNVQIGSSLRVGQSTVKRRIDRLVDGGACRVLAVVNPESLGYRTSTITLIKSQPGRTAQVAAALGSFPEVYWVGQTMGRYDIFVEALLPGPEGIFDLVARRIAQVPGVAHTETLLAVRQTRWRPIERRVSATPRGSGRADRGETTWRDDAAGHRRMIGGGAEISGSERLDDVDMRIVRLLQENGRRAAAEIARMVRLSQPAVKNRIDRLVDRGVCKIVGVIDPGALGLAAGALVYMRTEPERLVEIGESLARMPAISWLCHTTGEFDILAEVHMAGAQEVLEFVDRTIAAIPGIRSTEVSLVVGHSGWRPTAWCPLST